MPEEVVYRIVWTYRLGDGSEVRWVELYSPWEEVAQAYLRRMMETLEVLNEEVRPRGRVWIEIGPTVQGACRIG